MEKSSKKLDIKKTKSGTFNPKLKAEDVEKATRLIVQTKKPNPVLLTQYGKFGVSKANNILKLLDRAGVTKLNDNKSRTLILRGEGAVNAALRELKKVSK